MSEFPNSNVVTKRYDDRTATCNGHFSLAGVAGLRKYVYGNGSYIGNYPRVRTTRKSKYKLKWK